MSNLENLGYSEFEQWLLGTPKGFITRNGGWKPQNIKGWWDRVEGTKKNIRKIIGGESIQRNLSLETTQGAISDEALEPYVKEILELTPTYFTDNQITKDTLKMPLMPKGSHDVIKVGKHYREYALNYLAGRSSAAVYDAGIRKVEKLMAKLGQEWATQRSSKSEIEVTLSTTPKAFALLGHYGPDKDSCYSQGSTSPYHKWVFGQSTDVFVITISKFDATKGKNKNVARCIGYLSGQNFGIGHYYFAPKFNEGDGIAAIKSILESVSSTKLEFAHSLSEIRSDSDYFEFRQNEYGNWSFYPQGATKDYLRLKLNSRQIINFNCPRCERKLRNDEGWQDVDAQFVCSECVRQANVCEISHRRTFNPQEILNDKGIIISVHPEVFQNGMTCEGCGSKSLKIVTIRDKNICQGCLEADYDECEECGELCSNEELDTYDDELLCSKCAKNLEVA